MAKRWSTQHICAEHRDLQVNAMAVDYYGQLALLAGRRTIAIVDLDKPKQVASKVPRQSKWQIDAVQWNPHASHAHLFITACNQRADVWSCENKHSKQQGSLKAHTRVISDVDWSPHNPNTIATCSVDTYTHIWDNRDVRKPKLSLQGISGVSQVKWNKLNSHLLATCHDGDIRVWDARKANQPFQYIAGHLSKIHGLDWSPHNEEELATSSQDCSVKFWNINQPRHAIDKLSPSDSPVWRARYTPFGRGLTTVVVSQLRRGENNLSLWSLDDLGTSAQTSFVGHTDVLLEFQWRNVIDNKHPLVTWSKDQTLRLWSVDSAVLKACGVDVEVSDDEGISIFPSGSNEKSPSQLLQQQQSLQAATLNGSNLTEIEVSSDAAEGYDENGRLLAKTPPMNPDLRREEVHSPQQPKTIKQEFDLVNFDVNNVKVEELDTFKRKCVISAVNSNGQHMVTLIMVFPDAYPNNVPPNFELHSKSKTVQAQQTSIIEDLNRVATHHVHYSRSCIEPCLRRLVKSLDNLKEEDHDRTREETEREPTFHGIPNSRPLLNAFGLFPPVQPYQDRTVPFPRTSGARFSGSGFLVCFTRKSEPPRRTVSTADGHPRALGDLHTPQRPGISSVFGFATTPPSDNAGQLQQYYDFKDTHSVKTKRARSKSRTNTRQDSFSKLDPSGNSVSGGSPKKKDKQRGVGPVIIYDIHCITPINKRLAENYVLDTDNIEHMCTRNAELSAQVGRQDLVQLWSLIALTVPPALKSSLDPAEQPWASHPFGRDMIKSLIDHYASLSDVQTLAMLTCAIGSKYDPDTARNASSSVSRTTSDYSLKGSHTNVHVWEYIEVDYDFQEYNTYHTIHSTDRKEWSHITNSKTIKRSNSWSDMREEYDGLMLIARQDEGEKEIHMRNIKLVDQCENNKYDQFKRAYADILYKMGFLKQRAQVLKYVSQPPENHTGIEFKTRCHYCENETRGVQCFHKNCKQIALQCVICHIAVRGSSSFCLACGHGGHSTHMMQWFTNHDVCPSGCGCQCLLDNPMSAVNGD